ncbi:MAG: NADH-quinone oxidoreductase subunit K, partial [Gemmatimonadales bacterium]
LVLSNGVNLAIFIAGRFGSRVPPLVPPGETTIAVSANPLPQALILTAIVISFALAAFTAVLLHGAYRKLGTVDSDAMRLAEGSSTGQGTGPGAEAA